jgi:hypothetical protein
MTTLSLTILEPVITSDHPIQPSHKEVAMERPGSLDRYPDCWSDPLELYGEHVQELMSVGCNMETERSTLTELIEKYGEKWVWCNRHRLVPVAKALTDYPRR